MQIRRVLVSPGVLGVEIRLETAQHGSGMRLKARLLQMHAQFVIRHLAQHGHGIVKQVLPAARGQFLKQILRLLIPRPPQVMRELVQARNQLIQFRARQWFSRHSFLGEPFPVAEKLRYEQLCAMIFLAQKRFGSGITNAAAIPSLRLWKG